MPQTIVSRFERHRLTYFSEIDEIFQDQAEGATAAAASTRRVLATLNISALQLPSQVTNLDAGPGPNSMQAMARRLTARIRPRLGLVEEVRADIIRTGGRTHPLYWFTRAHYQRGVAVSEQTRELAHIWRNLSEAERDIYREKAAEERCRLRVAASKAAQTPAIGCAGPQPTTSKVQGRANEEQKDEESHQISMAMLRRVMDTAGADKMDTDRFMRFVENTSARLETDHTPETNAAEVFIPEDHGQAGVGPVVGQPQHVGASNDGVIIEDVKNSNERE